MNGSCCGNRSVEIGERQGTTTNIRHARHNDTQTCLPIKIRMVLPVPWALLNVNNIYVTRENTEYNAKRVPRRTKYPLKTLLISGRALLSVTLYKITHIHVQRIS